jgi:chemotaxis protein MotB
MRTFLVLFALLLVGVAGGGGYWLYKQNRRLTSDLEQCGRDQTAHKKQLGAQTAELKKTLDAQQAQEKSLAELEHLRAQQLVIEKQKAAFNALTGKLQSMIDAGKLNVLVREGRMIVKLPASVLFASGSADLSKHGRAALAQVAGVLQQFPDRSFMVTGHTDNEPVKESSYRNNWQLSTDRALVVTEHLVASGVKPENLVVGGSGEHDPIAANESPRGRADNRRIEIVLLPNVEELPRLIQETAQLAASPAPQAPARAAR